MRGKIHKNHRRGLDDVAMAAFDDEFEEFRARANSGGFLPYHKPSRGQRETKVKDTSDVGSRSPKLTPRKLEHAARRSLESPDGYLGDTEDADLPSDIESSNHVKTGSGGPSGRKVPALTHHISASELLSASHYVMRQKSSEYLTNTAKATDALVPQIMSVSLDSSEWKRSQRDPDAAHKQLRQHVVEKVNNSLSTDVRRKKTQVGVLLDVQWILGDSRPRVSSLPAITTRLQRLVDGATNCKVPPTLAQLTASRKHTSGDNLQKIRSFNITSKGLVKGEERYIVRSQPSLGSSLLPCIHRSQSLQSSHGSSWSAPSLDGTEAPTTSTYYVVLSGMVGVGKSSLIQKFVASELPFEISFGKFM